MRKFIICTLHQTLLGRESKAIKLTGYIILVQCKMRNSYKILVELNDEKKPLRRGIQS